jgi:hypothetical protein
MGGCGVMKNRPTIVCLCGSTKHRDAFEAATKSETLVGKIVLSVGYFAHEVGDLDMAGPIKRMLDQLHFRKIEMSDEVLILNVGGRIGLSTCDELYYAIACGKKVRFLESIGEAWEAVCREN